MEWNSSCLSLLATPDLDVVTMKFMSLTCEFELRWSCGRTSNPWRMKIRAVRFGLIRDFYTIQLSFFFSCVCFFEEEEEEGSKLSVSTLSWLLFTNSRRLAWRDEIQRRLRMK